MRIWVVTEASDDCDCGHRWIAYPADEESLSNVIEIAGLLEKPVYVAYEKEGNSG